MFMSAIADGLSRTDHFRTEEISLMDSTSQVTLCQCGYTLLLSLEFLVIGGISPWLGANPDLQSTHYREGSYPTR